MSTKSKPPAGASLDRLADLVNKAGLHLKAPIESPSAKAAAPNTGRALGQTPSEVETQESEGELFGKAMEGVERVSWPHSPLPPNKPAAVAKSDPDEEARILMQEAIDGNSPMDVLDHPEYIEGWIGVAGKRYLPNLRNGLYSIQGQIDLHGLNRAEARTAVEDYVIRMSRFRSCCIKIIHGRGINSPTDRATLKESLQRVLSTRRMSRYVVAFASAPLKDGGVGAVYVLLRKQ
jgi:DNA-nicking Smr family endonuclease